MTLERIRKFILEKSPQSGQEILDFIDQIKVVNNGIGVYYYKNNKLHRTDGPAKDCLSGDKYWYLNGKLHRKNGPAIVYSNGDRYWYLNGDLHRTDGPAVERSSGHKEWWINGKCHRTDGHAIEYASGSKEFWVDGYRVSFDKAISSKNSYTTGTLFGITCTTSDSCPVNTAYIYRTNDIMIIKCV